MLFLIILDLVHLVANSACAFYPLGIGDNISHSSKANMQKKVVIISGANSGIGKAAAILFASRGYRVVMACRDMKRSTLALKDIREVSKSDQVELMQLDISSFRSIQRFCTEFRSRYHILDCLIHNAAYFNHGEKKYQLSPDGIELTFATNTFGPFLMSMLLRDLLAKSQDPRILMACTTNIKHFFNPKRQIDFDNLRGELKDSKAYSVYKMYGDSKMALLMLTYKMAEEFKEEGIKVNAVLIPGIRQSGESIQKFSSYYRLIALLMNPFLASPESMAAIYFHICHSGKFKNISGSLVNNKNKIIPEAKPDFGGKDLLRELWKLSQVPPYAHKKENMEKIWRLSEKLTKSAVGNPAF